MKIIEANIHSLRTALASNQISTSDLLASSLSQINDNKSLNCFISTTEEIANTAINKLNSGEITNSKSLAGIPVAIKDVILAIGSRTTAASKILHNFESPYNATVIDKLLAAGAVIVGKTNLDEFAMGSSNENSFFGPVLNPWNTEHVAGGSSGGSAVAVACGAVPVALGTDTGGSIRLPASYCGVLGIRPTYGRVSRYGVVAYASSLDQVGVFARFVEDAALVLETIAGYDTHDATSSKRPVPAYCANLNQDIKGLRIGLPRQYFDKAISSEVTIAVKQALEILAKRGAVLVDIDLPHTKYAVPVYYIIAPAEASSNLGRYDGVRYGHRATEINNLAELYSKSRSAGFGDEVKRRILIGTYVLSKGYYDRYYRKARLVQSLIANDFDQVFNDKCDLIACATAPTTAFKLGEKVADPVQMYLSDILTVPSNLAGLPALSTPCGFDMSGLPIGLQLIGKKWDEQTILNVASAYQADTDWHKRYTRGVTN